MPATATAFGDRSAPFNVSIDSVWEDPADDEANVAWTRHVWQELHGFSSGQAYLNFPGELEEGNNPAIANLRTRGSDLLEQPTRALDDALATAAGV